MFPSPFLKCRKDVPKAALISWVLCDTHFQTTFRSAGDIVQVTFFKSIICLKLFKDLEINLLKMMSCKEDSIKVFPFCIQAACSLKSTTKNPQVFNIWTQMKSKQTQTISAKITSALQSTQSQFRSTWKTAVNCWCYIIAKEIITFQVESCVHVLIYFTLHSVFYFALIFTLHMANNQNLWKGLKMCI